MGTETPESSRAPVGAFVGAGCFSAVAGFFGGGMIAVMIAKIVGSVRGCQPPDGLPACDWGHYAIVGMLVGVVLLPLLSIWRLTRRRK